MDNEHSISNFAEELKNALSGDLSGWKLVYRLGNGLKRYVMKDHLGRVYDAYVYRWNIRILDPDMQVVSS